MKSRRVFAGVLLLVLIVFGCSEASAWWFGGSLKNELIEPSAGMVSTKTTTIPLPDGGTQTTTETVIKPSETGALAGAAVGGTIGGIAGWIFGPA